MEPAHFARTVLKVKLRDHKIRCAVDTSFGVVWSDGADDERFWRFVEQDRLGEIHVRLTLAVKDRDTGAGTTINRDFSCRPDFFDTEDEVARYVRVCLQDLWLHELDEQFTFDGKRIYDPHVTKERKAA